MMFRVIKSGAKNAPYNEAIRPGSKDALLRVFHLAGAAALSVYFLQGKGWFYHRRPRWYVAGGVLALGFARWMAGQAHRPWRLTLVPARWSLLR